MAKINLSILLLALNIGILSSQTSKESFWNPYIESYRIGIGLKPYDSLKFVKAYRIWTDHQVVELMQLTDSTFKGVLSNFITRIKRKNKREIISQNIKIPDSIVKDLMNKLILEDIENLKDCEEIENYVQGLDGITYIFEIGIKNNRRVYSYWEPENERYQNPKIKVVRNVRNILNAINNEFNLWEYFVKFKERLPKGNYSYGIIYMTKI